MNFHRQDFLSWTWRELKGINCSIILEISRGAKLGDHNSTATYLEFIFKVTCYKFGC